MDFADDGRMALADVTVLVLEIRCRFVAVEDKATRALSQGILVTVERTKLLEGTPGFCLSFLARADGVQRIPLGLWTDARFLHRQRLPSLPALS